MPAAMGSEQHDEVKRLKLRIAELESDKARSRQAVESEAKWQTLVSTAPDIILILDPEGRIQYINHILPGLTREEVIGSSSYDYVDPEYRALMRENIKSALQSDEFGTTQLVASGPEGSKSWYECRFGGLRASGQSIGVTVIATDITERKLAEEKLQAKEHLLRRLLDLRDREGALFALEVHDGLVQDIFGAQMQIQAALHDSFRGVDARAARQLEEAVALLERAIVEGRRMIAELRPIIIEGQGIVAAVEDLTAAAVAQDGLQIDFVTEGGFEDIPQLIESSLYRIVQEALANVRRHAHARRVEIQLVRDTHLLRAEVRDDGVGFDPGQVAADRFGVQSIQERARLFGGTAHIQSTPGNGTLVLAEIPLSNEAADRE